MSELASSKAEQNVHGNIHHNVPQSRGGSNEDCNLSEVAVLRHVDFHRLWASNRLPGDLVRLLAIHSLGSENPDHAFSPDQLSYICRATRNPDLSKTYRVHAVRNVSDPVGALLSLQSLENARTQLLEEMTWVRQTIAALGPDNATYPIRHHSLAPEAMRFFDVPDTTKAALGILSERNMNTLSWSRPMLANVRESLLNVLRGKHSFRRKPQTDYKPILQSHLSAITRTEKLYAQTKLDLVEMLTHSFNGIHREPEHGL